MTDRDQSSRLSYMSKKVQLETLAINFQELIITNSKQGSDIPLRLKEAELLALLCEAYPEVVTRSMIISQLWSTTYANDISVNQLINSVRKKLDSEYKPIVKTIPKVGYKLQIEPIITNECTNEDNTGISPSSHIFEPPTRLLAYAENIKDSKRLFNRKFNILYCLALLAGAVFSRFVHHFPFNRLTYVDHIPFTFEPTKAQYMKASTIDKSELLFVDKVDGELYSCMKSYVCNKL
ncbi:transcriptional regulator [Vibrio tetraodonis]|uniref:transcriptional regulator n=1 Tax=Vibrio tetraodonis TaxID=2231647 RepID=UPI000E0B74E0|nr:winged helix-turn-helix domain-containing protein [Vibrio tetraodonis]